MIMESLPLGKLLELIVLTFSPTSHLADNPPDSSNSYAEAGFGKLLAKLGSLR